MPLPSFFQIGVKLVDLVLKVPLPLPLWPKTSMAASSGFSDLADCYNDNQAELETELTFTEFWDGISEQEWQDSINANLAPPGDD